MPRRPLPPPSPSAPITTSFPIWARRELQSVPPHFSTACPGAPPDPRSHNLGPPCPGRRRPKPSERFPPHLPRSHLLLPPAHTLVPNPGNRQSVLAAGVTPVWGSPAYGPLFLPPGPTYLPLPACIQHRATSLSQESHRAPGFSHSGGNRGALGIPKLCPWTEPVLTLPGRDSPSRAVPPVLGDLPCHTCKQVTASLGECDPGQLPGSSAATAPTSGGRAVPWAHLHFSHCGSVTSCPPKHLWGAWFTALVLLA